MLYYHNVTQLIIKFYQFNLFNKKDLTAIPQQIIIWVQMRRQFQRRKLNNSSSLSRSIDRFELGTSRDKRETYPQMNNVMSGLSIFNDVQDEVQSFPWLGERDMISSLCSQWKQLPKKKAIDTLNPSGNVNVQGKIRTGKIYPQYADLSASGILVVSKMGGFQLFHQRLNFTNIQVRRQLNTSCVKFHDSENVAIAGDNGNMIIYNVEKSFHENFYFDLQDQCSQTLSLVWDNNLLYHATDTYLKGRDMKSETLTFSVDLNQGSTPTISTMSFKNNVLAIASKVGTLALYDMRMHKLLYQKNYYNQLNQPNQPSQLPPAFCVEWCPWKSDVLLCGFQSSLWEIKASTLQTISWNTMQSPITGLAYLPFGKELALSTTQQVLSIRDQNLEVKSVNSQLSGPKKTYLGCMVASKFDNKVAGITNSKMAYVWNVPYTPPSKIVNIANYPMEMMMR